MSYRKDYYKEWSKVNREYRLKYMSRWRKKNKDKVKAADKRYYLKLKQRSSAEVDPSGEKTNTTNKNNN